MHNLFVLHCYAVVIQHVIRIVQIPNCVIQELSIEFSIYAFNNIVRKTMAVLNTKPLINIIS